MKNKQTKAAILAAALSVTTVNQFALVQAQEKESNAGIPVQTSEVNTTSETKAKKHNDWVIHPLVEGCSYGHEPTLIVGQPLYGEAVVTFEDDRGNTYSEFPKDAHVGSWRMKVYVAGTDEYGEMTYVGGFSIYRATSKVKITNELSKAYDGLPCAAPTYEVTGSSGAVTVTYYDEMTKEKLATAPSEIGRYRVVVNVAGDENYIETSTSQVFKIAKARNSWVITPTIEGWTYGETPNTPYAKAKVGEVIYSYSDESRYGTFGPLPENPHAGTWYLHAYVEGSDQYYNMNEYVEFTIAPATSTIEITNSLDKVYDGKSVTPEIKQSRDGEVTYTWYDNKGNVLDEAPVDAGKYKVVATLAATENYAEATTEQTFEIKTFTQNTWKVTPKIEGWTYGDPVNTPTAEAIMGEPIFLYSDTEDGVFGELPEHPHAGTWYMRAIVPATKNYNGFSLERTFYIRKAKVDMVEFPEDQIVKSGTLLKDIQLPSQWQWRAGDKTLTSSGYYEAYLPVDDMNYNYHAIEGYDASAHCINHKVYIEAIETKENKWLQNLTMEGWTYGQSANQPKAESAYGEVSYLYSNASDGKYSTTVPHTAGTWYVKAVVEGTDDYAGLMSDPIAFIIAPKEVTDTVVPAIENEADEKNVQIKDGGVMLKAGSDYDVEKTTKDHRVTLTFTFKGNYKGVITRTYTIPSESIVESTDGSIIVNSAQEHHVSIGLLASVITIGAGCMLLFMNKKRKMNKK